MLTRRRALLVAAAALAPAMGRSARAAEAVWRGSALGAHAEIRLRHLGPAEAAPIFAAVEAEVARLEAIFSLYRADSALSALNREGRLADPPPELLELLSLSAAVHRQTGGLFDPTVQPLFRLYAEAGIARRPVAPEALAEALSHVGFSGVAFAPGEIRFARPGMALTLNGIAQGYVTDRIAARLRAEGLRDLLVDLGEISALGSGPSGAGWRIGIEGGPTVTLAGQAIATSAPFGTTLDAEGRTGHILHPGRGWIRPEHARVSVIASSAAHADALSTAAVLIPSPALAALSGGECRIIAG